MLPTKKLLIPFLSISAIPQKIFEISLRVNLKTNLRKMISLS